MEIKTRIQFWNESREILLFQRQVPLIKFTKWSHHEFVPIFDPFFATPHIDRTSFHVREIVLLSLWFFSGQLILKEDWVHAKTPEYIK